MTYDQYWNDDPELVRFYREAAEIRADRKNQELWLQGMYIYEALCCVSPVMRAFAKKNTKPVPYPKHPYPINQRQEKRNEVDAEKRVMEKGKALLFALMQRNNQRNQQAKNENVIKVDTEPEGGEADGGNH